MGTWSTNDLDAFVPEIWSMEVKRNFDVTSVMRGLCNTDYEGEIKNVGDTVKIRQFGNVTIGTYSRATDITATNLSPTVESLSIDKFRYFAFEVDDVDAVQNDINAVQGYTRRAGVALADAIDLLLLAEYANAHSSIGTTGVGIDLASTSVDVYNQIVDIGVRMDEHNIPSVTRTLVVPPRVAGVMRKNSQFVNADKSGDGGALFRTGLIGSIAGMDIVVSNNITSVDADSSSLTNSVYPCVCLTRDAITFAMQLTKVEAVRPSLRFTTLVKGLAVFGYKTLQSTAMVTWYVDATTI